MIETELGAHTHTAKEYLSFGGLTERAFEALAVDQTAHVGHTAAKGRSRGLFALHTFTVSSAKW